MKKHFTKLAIVAAGLGLAGIASAATTEGCPFDDVSCVGTINVTGAITGACSHLSTTDIDFGIHPFVGAGEPTPTPWLDEAASTIEVTCNTGVAYNVELDDGVNPDNTASPAIRQTLADDGSGELVDYYVYQPNGAGQIGDNTNPEWGSVANGLEYSDTGTGAVQAFPVYAEWHQVPTNSPGRYTDLITVTLNFP